MNYSERSPTVSSSPELWKRVILDLPALTTRSCRCMPVECHTRYSGTSGGDIWCWGFPWVDFDCLRWYYLWSEGMAEPLDRWSISDCIFWFCIVYIVLILQIHTIYSFIELSKISFAKGSIYRKNSNRASILDYFCNFVVPLYLWKKGEQFFTFLYNTSRLIKTCHR